MVELGQRGHAKSSLAQYKFDPDGARLVGAACIASKDRCAFVAEANGKIVGVLLGCEQNYEYVKAKLATDLVYFAELPGAGAKLMRRFIDWALEERRVQQVLLSETFGGRAPEKSHAFYRRLGASHVGGMYVIHRRS